jgi:hypothetical protein
MNELKLISSIIASLFVSVSIIVFELTVMPTGMFSETIGILFFPAAPIIYGLITRDKIGSVMVGAMPIVGTIIFGMLISGQLYDISDITLIIYLVSYYGGLSVVGGLEGYFASKGEFMVAIGFGALWVLVFFSGLD